MFYLIVILTTGFNCLVLFLLTYLRVIGNSNDSVLTMALYTWVAGFTAISLYLCKRSKGVAGFLLNTATLPLWLIVYTLTSYALQWWPNSSEFNAACKDAGAKYFAQPSLPVHSITYYSVNGESKNDRAFNLEAMGRIDNIHSAYPTRLPSSIQVMENHIELYSNRDVSHIKNDAYIRRLKSNADIMVSYSSKEIGYETHYSFLKQYDVVVTDLRDGKLLASLRYLYDEKMKRACGTTSENIMDEGAFLMKALGIQAEQRKPCKFNEACK
jgi:hypothetical protein